MKEADMGKVVAWIDRLISDPDNEALPAQVGEEVKAFAGAFPLFAQDATTEA